MSMFNQKSAIVFGTLLSLSVIAGCSVSNVHNNKNITPINSAADAQAIIKTGMTMSQVEAKLGRPAFQNTFNNKTIWGYQNRTTNFNTPKKILGAALGGTNLPDSKMLTIHFSEQGIVERVDFNQQTF